MRPTCRALALAVLSSTTSLAVACGPSKESVEAEHAGLVAMLDQQIAMIRKQHACDAENKAFTEAMDEYISALKSNSRALMEAAQSAESRAEAKKDMCRKLQPSWEEDIDKLRKLDDAWMDACLSCATGRVCVDAERRRRGALSPGHEIPKIEEMKSWVACRR